MKKWVSVVCLALVLTLLNSAMTRTARIAGDFSWGFLVIFVVASLLAGVSIVRPVPPDPLLILALLALPLRNEELQESTYLIVMFFFMLVAVTILFDLFYLLYDEYRRHLDKNEPMVITPRK